MQIELNAVYKRSDNQPLKVIRHESQQQWKGAGNCGLFAIANAYAFCEYRQVDCHQNFYNEKKMRSHLIKCLERGHFTGFPTAGRNRKAKQGHGKVEHRIPPNVMSLLKPPQKKAQTEVNDKTSPPKKRKTLDTEDTIKRRKMDKNEENSSKEDKINSDKLETNPEEQHDDHNGKDTPKQTENDKASLLI